MAWRFLSRRHFTLSSESFLKDFNPDLAFAICAPRRLTNMFSHRAVISRCLLLICILELLQYVSAYVAQLPSTIVESVQNSSFATSRRSSAIFSNGYVYLFTKPFCNIILTMITSTLGQEDPPCELRVEYWWKSDARPFGRLDFLNTIVLNAATMALRQWNNPIPAFKFPTSHQIAMGFVSDRQGTGLRIKHIIWALDEIFDIIIEHDRNLPGDVVIKLVPITIGLGNVYTVPAGSTPVKPTDVFSGDLADDITGGSIFDSTSIASNNTILAADLAPQTYWEGDASPILTLPSRQQSDIFMPNPAAGNVKVQFWYRHNGAPVDGTQVYNASLKLLTRAAEPVDVKATIWPGLSQYNDMDNITMTIRPENFALRKDLNWFDTIFALASIAGTMAKHGGPPGKFAEIDGSIVAGETTIGRFCIEKGDKTRRNPEDICVVRTLEIGNDEGGMLTT